MHMGIEDYAFSVLMMSSVVRQLRGRRLGWWGLSWPLGLVIWAAEAYLQDVPRRAGDLRLVIGLALVGAVLGLSCGALSRVYVAEDEGGRRIVMVRSTGTAAILWVVGMGARLAFGLLAEHGGVELIGRFSASLGVTSAGTWATALVLMSLLEVAGRTVLLAPRLQRGLRDAGGGRQPMSL